jgi:hypothetical protein
MNIMLDKIKNSVSMGFGKKEAAKTTKGVAIGGVGAVAYSIIFDIGYMPESLTSPDVVPYVVAGLSSVINAIRHFFQNNMS